MLPDLSDLIGQLLEDIRYSWEYTQNTPSGGAGKTELGTVLYSRHCKGGAFESSFRYWMDGEIVLVLFDVRREIRFAVDLAHPDSLQLASDFIRKIWDRQQSARLPIDRSR